MATLLGPNKDLKTSPSLGFGLYFMPISGFWRRGLYPAVTQWVLRGEASATQMSTEGQMEKLLANRV